MNFSRLVIYSTILFVSAAASAYANEEPAPYPIRIGYTSFEPPSSKNFSRTTTYGTARLFLQLLSDESKKGVLFNAPIEFNISVGSYYQIYEWYRAGSIDAAIVTPFTAYLLKEEADAVIELVRPHTINVNLNGPHIPVLASNHTNPAKDYDEYLECLLKYVHKNKESSNCHENYSVQMPSHFSASGFVAPLAYAHRYIKGRLKGDDRAQFWQLYLTKIRFILNHCYVVNPEEKHKTVLYFSYTGKLKCYDKELKELEEPEWRPYEDPPFIVPNDVLIIRPTTKNKIVKPNSDFQIRRTIEQALKEQRKEKERYEQRGKNYDENRNYYIKIQHVDEGSKRIHDDFANKVRDLFGDPYLIQKGDCIQKEDPYLCDKYVDWYRKGKYEFSIRNIVRLLEHDQATSNTEGLALILQGGGVKGAYQAKLLDFLYGKGCIRNSRSIEHNKSGTCGKELGVTTIIGTSAGAINGFFAVTGSSSIQHWKKISNHDLLPLINVLRWVSIYIVVVVLWVSIRIVARNWPDYLHRRRGHASRRSLLFRLFIVSTICAQPLIIRLIQYFHPVDIHEEILYAAGIWYAITVMLGYVGLTYANQGDEEISNQSGTTLVSNGLVGIVFLLLPVIFFFGESSLEDGPSLPVVRALSRTDALIIGVCICFVVVQLALLSIRWNGNTRGCLLLSELRSKAVVIPMAVVSLTYGFLLFPYPSLIEVTDEFWVYLIVLGLLTSGIYIFLSRWLHARQRHQLCLGIDLGRMVFIFGLSLFFWTLFVTPSLYSSINYKRYFKNNFATEEPKMQATFIVTGTVVERNQETPDPAQGADRYYCFDENDKRCPPKTFCPASKKSIKNAVFASASPFPIFPPHRVNLSCGAFSTDELLIDGAYGHSVPIEAAQMTKERRVLVLRLDDPDIDNNEGMATKMLFPGPFTRYTFNLLPLMFDFAQSLDHYSRHNFFVASFVPARKHFPLPFLGDFREETIGHLLNAAEEDTASIDAIIGRIESWGLPTPFERVSPGQISRVIRVG